MGRHTIVNPASGRRVYKTGRIGRAVQSGKKKVTKSKKKTVAKPNSTKPKTSPKKKQYSGPGSTKRPSPLFKSAANGAVRPSARAMYDAGMCGPVYYNGKKHVMDFKANGSPYYRPLK